MIRRGRRTHDAEKAGGFAHWKSFERDYERQLRKVSGEIRRILEVAKTEADLRLAEKRLDDYVKLLSPWADLQAESMVMRVYEANERRWGKYAKQYGFNLRDVVTKGDLAGKISEMRAEAAKYIKSLPQESAARVGKLAQEAAMYGMRPEAIEERIRNEGDVSESRARMIARTEVARSNSMLVQARAESLGAQAYIWQTAEDSRVRESHMEMNGKVVYYNAPPTLDGLTGHAGCLPNCRCIQLPLLSDKELEEAVGKNSEQRVQSTREREMGYFEEPGIAGTGGATQTSPVVTDIVERATGVKKGQPIDIDMAVSMANPNYNKVVNGTKPYNNNCQRCVPVYELRRRGYNVEALPNLDGSYSRGVFDVASVYKNANILQGQGRTAQQNADFIEKHFLSLGDGARGQVVVVWDPSKGRGTGGHTFAVEVKGGRVLMVDPQTNERGVLLDQLKDAKMNSRGMNQVHFWRTDDLELDESVLDKICKEGTK